MSTRTVRLDDDAEATLKTLQKQTGLSISNVLKQGLNFLQRRKRRPPPQNLTTFTANLTRVRVTRVCPLPPKPNLRLPG